MQNDTTFTRLPHKVVHNDLWIVRRRLNDLGLSLKDGNDLELDDLDRIIEDLETVRRSARRFKSGEEVPMEYK